VANTCGVRWPWPGAVAGTNTDQRFTVFHHCAKPPGHPDDHECQCSFSPQQAPHVRYTKEREWVAR
jgi:hypothetical protein